MELSDDIQCVFSSRLEDNGDRFVIEVPERELTVGDLSTDSVYRVAIYSRSETESNATSASTTDRSRPTEPVLEPPVDVGEERTVEIEDIGKQGDGIARVERGYVIIVPDTDVGERVVIEITDTSETVGFAEVIERKDFYE